MGLSAQGILVLNPDLFDCPFEEELSLRRFSFSLLLRFVLIKIGTKINALSETEDQIHLRH